MSQPETILNRADMEMSRTPRELCHWIETKAEELSKTTEGKAYARSGNLLPKKLWEEIRPLGLFALHRFGDKDVRCTPNLSNDNYDGKIEFSELSARTIYVEITYAKDGHDERLRLSVLTNDGNVNAFGKITVSGTKASGQIIMVEDNAVDHTIVREAALEHVKKRLHGKNNKQYGKDHILIVVVDDDLIFRTDEDKEILMNHAQAELAGLSLNVGAVYLLGSSGRYCARLTGAI